MTQQELADAIRKELENDTPFDVEKMGRLVDLCVEAGAIPLEYMTQEQWEAWLGKK